MHVTCLSYKDKNSIGGDALKDLKRGEALGIVACNSPNLGTKKAGDLVIILARGTGKKADYFSIVEILGPSENTTAWADAGGQTWKYNMRCKSLTGIRELTQRTQDIRAAVCAKHGLRPTDILNGRCCTLTCGAAVLDFISQELNAPL